MFLVERRISYPEDFLNLADLANGCFGSVKLVKCKRDNKVYALKIIHRVNDAEARAFVYFDDRNCSQANNLVREIKFLKEIRDIDKIKHPNIVELVCSWC
jgi:serine/threonine protein kinase